MGVSTDRQGKQGQVDSLEVATLNNSGGLWTAGVLPRCLLSASDESGRGILLSWAREPERGGQPLDWLVCVSKPRSELNPLLSLRIG